MMKCQKKLLISLTILCMLLATACSKASNPRINWDESYGIVVQKNGNNKVTVIMSPTRSIGTTREALDEEKKKYGYYSAEINPDGSITRVVTEDYYNRLIAAMDEVTRYYAQTIVFSDQYPNIVYAAYTKDFKASVLFTKNEHADQTGITAMLFLVDQAKNYLAITGQDPEQKPQSYIVNATTGEYLYGMTEEKVEEIDAIIQAYLNGERTYDENRSTY